MVRRDEDLKEDGVGVNANPMTCVGVLNADDTGIALPRLYPSS